MGEKAQPQLETVDAPEEPSVTLDPGLWNVDNPGMPQGQADIEGASVSNASGVAPTRSNRDDGNGLMKKVSAPLLLVSSETT